MVTKEEFRRGIEKERKRRAKNKESIMAWYIVELRYKKDKRKRRKG